MRYVGAKSSASRITNFKAKMRAYSGTGSAPDYMPPVNQHKLDEMYRLFQESAGDQTDYVIRAKEIISKAGESIIKLGGYTAFCGQMYHVVRQFPDAQRRTEAATLIALWVARGMTQSVLEDIRTDVFSVGAAS